MSDKYKITVHYDRRKPYQFERWTPDIWKTLEDLRIQYCINGNANRISASKIATEED